MKKLIKHFKVFFPALYSLLMYLGLPIVVFAGSYLIAHTYVGSVGIILVLGVLCSIHLFADYFVFNGICSKGASLRLMKSSFVGLKVLKKGTVMDQILRFVSIMFCAVGATIILNRFGSTFHIPMSITVLFGLIEYALVSAILIGLRYIDGAALYGPILSLGATLAVGIIVVLFMYWSAGNELGCLAYAITVAGCIIATFFNSFTIIESYKKSFIR